MFTRAVARDGVNAAVWRRWSGAALCSLLVAHLLMPQSAAADQGGTSWLDVPQGWQRGDAGGVVTVIPHDLPAGRSLVLMVEPLTTSDETPEAAYQRSVQDLGPWRPVGTPLDQQTPEGWAFRQGVGVVTFEGTPFTALIFVARRERLLVRMWVLADSDDTFNRYKPAIVNAMASVQDLKTGAAPKQQSDAATASAPTSVKRTTPPVVSVKLDENFGKGVSGVYVGIERGLQAGAGAGAGQQQVFNPSTGRYEVSSSGSTPQLVTQIGDYVEVDVFFPDGTYRRRLPVRGLMSDSNWERQQQKPLWGTWRREGNKVVVKRGGYSTTYTLDGEALVSDRGRAWRKLSLITGARITGTYARDDYREKGAPRITFKSDGTYAEHDNFMRMVGSSWHLVEPDADSMLGRWTDAQMNQAMIASSGTYSFDNFTLTLRASDGRIWQVNAYIPAGDSGTQPQRLVINGRLLMRD